MKTPEAYAATLRERTERAVRATLRRRGGIASQMSSGFDSSAVTVTAARLLAEEGQALTAYTHVPRPGWNPADDWPGTRGDEGPLAALAAARYPNIRHVCLPFAQGDLVGSSRQLLGLAGRPIRNLLNTVWLRQIGEAAAAGGATTMLVGSAGNATISFDGALLGPWLLWRGHGWRWLAQALRVPAGPGRNAYVRESVRAGVPSEWVAAVRRLLGRVQPVNEVPHPVRAGLLGDAAQQAALGLQLRDRPGAWPRVNQLALRRRLLTDADPGAVRKAWLALTGVEWRDPLAARDLCEWCFAIPAERYAQAGQRRSLYKQAFAHDLPAELIGQTRRGEQAADWIPTVEAARSAILEQIDLARGDGCWNAVLDLERMAQPLNSPRPLHPRTDLVEVKFVTLRGLSALLFGQVAGAADITRRQLCEA